MLAVVVVDARDTELNFEARRFGTTGSELRQLLAWLQELAVKEVAMELGYSNLSNFTIAFKKEFGLLPSKLLTTY